MDKNTGTDNVVRRLSGADTKAARPRAEVLAEVMDPGRAKGEHEHVAADEIAALRAERDEAKAAATEASTALADALARVEALEAFMQDLADESCLDRGSHRNQEACGETNLRLIDYCGPCRARALLEEKS